MTAARSRKTVEDLHALGPDANYELIDGELVERASPTGKHAMSQGRTYRWVSSHFEGDPGGQGRALTWIFGTEWEVQLLSHRVVRPDVSGWRLALHPGLLDRLDEFPLAERPDWVCEVVSDSNVRHDVETKLALYYEAKVAHYWTLDPTSRRLLVHRWTAEGYLVVQNVTAGQSVQAEPFDGVVLDISVLLPPEGPRG